MLMMVIVIMKFKEEIKMSKVDKMYDAVQELICAFVVNQEAVEKAKTQKKSMLKARTNPLQR